MSSNKRLFCSNGLMVFTNWTTHVVYYQYSRLTWCISPVAACCEFVKNFSHCCFYKTSENHHHLWAEQLCLDATVTHYRTEKGRTTWLARMQTSVEAMTLNLSSSNVDYAAIAKTHKQSLRADEVTNICDKADGLKCFTCEAWSRSWPV